MTDGLKTKRYGKFEWIGLDDEPPEQPERKREQPTRSDKGQRGNKVAPEEKPEDFKPKGGSYEGKSWHTILRTRWLNLMANCRRRGIDGLPWDAYKALWYAAGKVEAPWGGEQLNAYELTAKYWETRFRCQIAQIETGRGMVRGNVMIVAVQGHWRNKNKFDVEPEYFEVLAKWEEDGSVVDGSGTICDYIV